MNPAGLDGPLSRAASTAARYVTEINSETVSQLEDAVLNLLRCVGSIEPTARLTPSSPQVSEFLYYAHDILLNERTSPTTRSKINRLLYNLSYYNVSLRRYMANDLRMCNAVFHCLRLSIQDQLGPQNMLDILRLLQILTYESTVELGQWTDPLLSFIMQEINKDKEQEWLGSCMAILCNLVCRSKSVCKRMQKSSQFKKLYKKFYSFFGHDERIVVIATLVIVGYLDEKLRNCVFNPRNMKDTFLCVFNILIYGDANCVLTRHIACDFLKRLVVSEQNGLSAVPVITEYGEEITRYPYFAEKMQQVAELFVNLDPRAEESDKIYDTIQAFCFLPQLVSPVAAAIVSCEPTTDRLTTPLMGIAATAAMSPEEAIDPMVPIKAMTLLRYLCKEIIDSNRLIADKITATNLLALLENTLKTTVDTSYLGAAAQCQRIVAGLRLAEAVSHDEEFRNYHLIQSATAQLCSHILEFQFSSNPVVLQMSKPPMQRGEKVPDWSIHGVSIVLQVIKLLASLKDFSKPHKLQYWSTLKDERIIPFIAYAISYGDHDMVHDSLHLYTHCCQIQEFKSKWLGDLVASCVIAKRCQVAGGGVSYDVQQLRPSTSASTKRKSSPELMETSDCKSPDPFNGNVSTDSRSINELLERIRGGGLEIKDVKMSEILATYEKKIFLLQEREKELERMLQSTERLRQTRTEFGRNNEADLAKIRVLVQENEQLREASAKLQSDLELSRKVASERAAELRAENTFLRDQKSDLEADLSTQRRLAAEMKERSEEEVKRINQDWTSKYQNLLTEFETSRRIADEKIVQLGKELTLVRQERDDLNSEILQEREVVLKARQHAEEQKKRLEITSHALAEKNRENAELLRRVGELESDVATLRQKYDEERRQWAETKYKLETELESLRNRGQKTQADLDKMRRLREEMLRLAEGYE